MNKIPIYLKILRAGILLFFCFVLWMLLTGDFHCLSLTAGIVMAFIVVLYSYNIFYEKDKYYRSDFIIRFELFILYAILFVIQSYLASFELIYRIITGKYQAGTLRIKTKLKSKIARVLLANTISMIPGTLSLWLEGNHIFVHLFDTKTINTLKAGSMVKHDFETLLGKIFE